jgi:hypothetical protein
MTDIVTVRVPPDVAETIYADDAFITVQSPNADEYRAKDAGAGPVPDVRLNPADLGQMLWIRSITARQEEVDLARALSAVFFAVHLRLADASGVHRPTEFPFEIEVRNAEGKSQWLLDTHETCIIDEHVISEHVSLGHYRVNGLWRPLRAPLTTS